MAVARVARDSGAPVILLIGDNLGRVENIAEEALFFAREDGGAFRPRVRALPPPVALDAESGAFEVMCDLLGALSAVRHTQPESGAPLIIACSPDALRQPCPTPEALRGRDIVIRKGQGIEMRAFVETLERTFGYEREAVCEAPGQFAVRGGLVDVYPLNAQMPARVDFFGDAVEEIRAFDPTSQRSEAPLETLAISAPPDDSAPMREGAFLEYLPADALWLFAEPSDSPPEILGGIPAPAHLAAFTELDAAPEWLAAAGAAAGAAAHWDGCELSELFAGDFDDRLGMERLEAEERQRDDLLETLALWQGEGAAVRIVGETEGGLARMRAIVAEAKTLWEKAAAAQPAAIAAAPKKTRPPKKPPAAAASASSAVALAAATSASSPAALPAAARLFSAPDALLSAPFSSLSGGSRGVATPAARAAFAPEFSLGLLSAGFVVAAGVRPLVVATEREFFGRRRRRLASLRNRRMPNNKSQVEQLLDFNELVDGDALVHVQHGICLYRGINVIANADGSKGDEMISLEFDDKITIHVPLREAHLLSRYVGLRKAVPKLARLGSSGWKKTRGLAERATIDFAAELLGLQAKRRTRAGIAFPEDAAQPWLHEFERAFPHKETPDQARAIEETKRDMERPGPMDRLLCGDVGYGKTEIALRAAFKGVLAGYQVAILAPTTVLAQQHFNTFRERFAKYPLSVEMLSRFRTQAQRTKIIAQLNAGQIDIIIGTHALLSQSVKFPKLGLLVIDEEHRFGVGQKEIIKKMREEVDVLCMSATPIPRTLYLALMGARDLSVIETPPRERLPIQTLVRTYDVKLVHDAISYEVGRGGQVFYLHNRVETIESVAARLREMMPDVRFGVGHGQMPETELEDVMTEFVAGGFDVLVCTTIIETGLDIPNCNTLIIEGADRFGLAQLYQLRGRVGRFNRQAYAYLLLHKHSVIVDQARRRLSAIRQHNQLGAGLRIAMRDLELRGAGNLLGREQSGHIASVGFDLYCQLLRQSIARLNGDRVAAAIRAEVRLDFVRFAALTDANKPRSRKTNAGPDPTPWLDPLLLGDPGADGAGDAGNFAAVTPTRASKQTAAYSDDYRLLRDIELDDGRCPEIIATLPASYIDDTRLRIEIFRKLAMAATPEVVAEISAAMEDRFGALPESAEAFVALTELRCLAEARGLVSIETEGNRLKCRLVRPAADGGFFVKVGANFPRLSAQTPLKRIAEIRTFLLRQPSAQW
jgi:transcription-repair coupling factor (superfamily II helicase)